LSIKHEEDEGSKNVRDSIKISEIDLKIKKPVVLDTLKLACVKPEIA